ncbi:hypothetical protein MTYP_00735 [Methylophilaceae bacterium]|jgi:hypothetical protein|nr:hypothetical protein MTYP_00735 [Methylophilaceae bacterium]
MNNILSTTVIIAALLASTNVMARDDQKMHPLEDALNTPAAKEKLDPEIKLYFGENKHPKVATEIGEWKTNKKTNAFNKSDKDACEWTFLSAVLELQERARKEGGNAVINIKSNYKNKETSSETEYMCGSGALMSGVALKGTVVKLK